MRITDIIRLGITYLIPGLILAAIVVLGFAVGYFLVYKKILKGKKHIKAGTVAVCVMLMVYLMMVIGATMLSRPSAVFGTQKIQMLFYSYRDAWVNWKAASWRAIILNYVMFIPLGILLPLLGKIFRKGYVCYLAGFLFSAFIELVQLCTHRGLFEFDDLLGNTVGTMIGYGIFTFGSYVLSGIKKVDKKPALMHMILCQIPVILTILLFSMIFIQYSVKELGNNSFVAVKKYNMDRVAVNNNIIPGECVHSMPIYKAKVLSVKEAEAKGREVMNSFGLNVDESRTIVYDETLIMYSAGDGGNSIWIDYLGGKYTLTFPGVFFTEDGKESRPLIGASEEEVRNAVPFMIPADAFFTEQENGMYEFTVGLHESGEDIQSGTLRCNLYHDVGVGRIENRILDLNRYKDFETYDINEALEQIYAGRWSYYKDISEMTIESYRIDYSLDSKGFYQPDYVFSCILDGVQEEIHIPAIKL